MAGWLSRVQFAEQRSLVLARRQDLARPGVPKRADVDAAAEAEGRAASGREERPGKGSRERAEGRGESADRGAATADDDRQGTSRSHASILETLTSGCVLTRGEIRRRAGLARSG